MLSASISKLSATNPIELEKIPNNISNPKKTKLIINTVHSSFRWLLLVSVSTTALVSSVEISVVFRFKVSKAEKIGSGFPLWLTFSFLLGISNSNDFTVSKFCSFIRINCSSLGQSIFVILNMVLFIFLKSKFYSPVNYKSVQWCIDVFKNGVGYRSCINVVETCLSCIKEIFKVDVQRKPFPNFFSHKATYNIVFSCCSVIELLRTKIIGFQTDFPFILYFIHKYRVNAVFWC